MRILILGSGLMGKGAAFYLSGQDDVKEIIIADRYREKAEDIAQKIDGNVKITTEQFNACDVSKVREMMTGCSAALGCTSYDHNLLYTQTAIDTGCNLVDLGGNHDVVEKQFSMSDKAKNANVTIIPDCGLAPGLVSILTGRCLDRLDSVESVKIRVGGVPLNPRPPLNYFLVFSARGLINEYIEPSKIIQNGKVITVESMEGLETLHFKEPFGKMEAFYTSGGISTLTETMPDIIKNIDYKTIRYPGHQEYIKFLMYLGLTSSEPVNINGEQVYPRTLLEKLLEQKLQKKEDDEDVILLRVTAQGTRGSQKTTYSQEIIDRYDKKTNLTAMMRMTAFPAAQIALMIARETIAEKGVLYQEKSIPVEPFLSGIDKWGIEITEEYETL
jgi:lysine 6-dehydrogenase